MSAENQFLVSVADVMLFDTTGNQEQLILSGKTLLNSSLTQSMQTTAIYAGKGSQKVFEYNYQKELAFTIEDAAFDTAYICLQNGTKVNNQLAEIYTQEKVTFDASGVATVTGAPIGVVQAQLENGEYATLTSVGATITDLRFANKAEVNVIYAEAKTVDTITIDAKTFPKAMKMVLNVDIYTNNGKEQEMQITVPKFKPDGALELSMTHDGVSSSALAGSALADKDGNYAYIAFNNIAGTTAVAVTSLAATPTLVEFDLVSPTPVKPVVLGIRGGVYGNITLDNTALTWTSDDASIATVAPDGTIALAGGIVGDTVNVRVTDGTYTDVIQVEVV